MHLLEVSSTYRELRKIYHHRKHVGVLMDFNGLFGIFLTLMLASCIDVDGSRVLQDIAEVIASHLEVLIDQLMHNPVGLKLNEPLSKALGGFFLHHIHLWRLYIISVQSLMSALLVGFCFLGLFGASSLIAGASDLLLFVTLHCYVFYIYAARLFNINILSVISLWRMFRGKKYNPIRQCIDSGQFGTDQIIVGMLLFMIAGFMLPTSAVYYFVFLALWLLLKGVSVLLSFLQEKMRSTSPVLIRWGSPREVSTDSEAAVKCQTSVMKVLHFLGKLVAGEVI